MTSTTRTLINQLEATLDDLPDAEQQERAASYLADARQHRNEQAQEVEPYSSFTFLQEANLDLPSDYSETYEEHLYGEEAVGEG